MTGGRGPKRKGYVFECELIDMAKRSGLDAERAWGSNGAALRLHPSVDCVIAGQRVQAKRRRKLADWLATALSEHVDAVALREDRGEPVVLLRFADWLDLVACATPVKE